MSQVRCVSCQSISYVLCCRLNSEIINVICQNCLQRLPSMTSFGSCQNCHTSLDDQCHQLKQAYSIYCQQFSSNWAQPVMTPPKTIKQPSFQTKTSAFDSSWPRNQDSLWNHQKQWNENYEIKGPNLEQVHISTKPRGYSLNYEKILREERRKNGLREDIVPEVEDNYT